MREERRLVRDDNGRKRNGKGKRLEEKGGRGNGRKERALERREGE